MLVLFTLLITITNIAQHDANAIGPTLHGSAADANAPQPAADPNQSFLALIAPLFELDSWPVYFLDASQMPAADGNSPITADNSPISALAMHALCADILQTYVSEKGLVDYKTLRRKRLGLLAVLGEYASLDPNSYASWSKADQLAFWLNAYNMATLKGVIDNYPIQPSRFKVIFYPPNSVMQLSSFWKTANCRIMGENYSLEEMENKIIRGLFDEPRVCFGICNASAGAPPLRREPYYGKNLGDQLDDQARIFLASERGMKIDRAAGSITLSPIFQWYAREFIVKYPPARSFSDKPPAEAAVLTYISRQLPKKDSDWLTRKIFEVKYARYDWTLNEQP